MPQVRRYVFGAIAAFAALTWAAPIPEASSGLESRNFKRQAPPALTDLDILQFALTLEHLESNFYSQGFAKFPAADFLALGLQQSDVDALIQIGATEAAHVTALMAAISGAGATPVQACTYNFGFTDAKSMVATARILEAVGVSAYLGAAPLVQDKAILAAAGSIVTIESRHQTFIRLASGSVPVPQAFDTPLGPRSIFTLAAAFISSCPAGSALPFTPFESLVIVNAETVTAGTNLMLADLQTQGANFCSFTAGGVGNLFAPFQNGGCVVPSSLAGEVYVHVTSSQGDGKTITDDIVVAGPAVVTFS